MRGFSSFASPPSSPHSLRSAFSTTISGSYKKVACEAPTLFHRHGTDTYVLMYDVFGARPNNMGFSETTDFTHFKNLGRFNDTDSPMKSTNFTGPKHGAVMPITPEEAKRLGGYFVTRSTK